AIDWFGRQTPQPLLALFRDARGMQSGIDAPLLDAVTRDDPAGRCALQERHLDAAALIGIRAARVERASWRRREWVGHFTGHRRARLATHRDIWNRVE